MNAIEQAINHVIWRWHIAECLHLIRGTKCEPQYCHGWLGAAAVVRVFRHFDLQGA